MRLFFLPDPRKDVPFRRRSSSSSRKISFCIQEQVPFPQAWPSHVMSWRFPIDVIARPFHERPHFMEVLPWRFRLVAMGGQDQKTLVPEYYYIRTSSFWKTAGSVVQVVNYKISIFQALFACRSWSWLRFDAEFLQICKIFCWSEAPLCDFLILVVACKSEVEAEIRTNTKTGSASKVT